MDPHFNGILKENQSMARYSNGKIGNGPRFEISYPGQKLVNNEHKNQEHCIGGGVHLVLEQPFSNGSVFSSFVDIEDDCDFSDAVLRYIDQVLMEEDMEEKTHMLQESLDLEAKERSFYEVLGKKYPPSPSPQRESAVVGGECVDDDSNPYAGCFNSTTSSSSGYLIDIVDPSWINARTDHDPSVPNCVSSCTHASKSSSNSLNHFVDGLSDSPISPLQIRDMYNESRLVWDFRRGVDEASKFLPSVSSLLGNASANTSTTQREIEVGVKNDVGRELPSGSRGKKSRSTTDTDMEEERSSKLPAVYAESDSDVPVEEFDDVLLHTVGDREKKFAAYREVLQNSSGKGTQKTGQVKRSGARSRGKKQNKKKEVIDLRTLLINCAQAVAADDRRNASELLKQIRQHASPYGEGNMRLAHYFADGLEARLAGTGSQIHKALVNKKTTASDYLKAYYTYLASSPFKKISNFTSNKTIILKSMKETRVHVIDFGILYGFQWATLIQRLSLDRKDGPPKLRITGIDFPQPGFRPAEKIEETGRRLARYAKEFNVPFEYNAIAKKWENVKIEDLKLEKDEFVVVNCMYRAKNLLDETVLSESSRTIVLNLIRKISPDYFIHGIVNGAYSAPFFVTRFREVLFHFSALFDMLELNIPRDKPERMLIERDIFGSEALNVIACEGWERVERPETYKQWQVRHLRAGFAQVPLERHIMDVAIGKVRTQYHKDFVIDEDNQWMLMGWKGRIIYAISCWQPA